MTGLRPALRHRDFRLLLAGQTASGIGDQMLAVAFAVRILDGGGGATGLGLVLGASALSMLLFVLVGGVVADRLRRTRVLVGTDVVRAAVVLFLALGPAHIPLLVLAALNFVMGAAQAFFSPAFGALFPTVLPRDDLQSGNALTSVSLRTTAVAGPALAGLVVAVAGVRAAFLVDAASFVVSTLTLLRITEPPVVRTDPKSGLQEGLMGLRAVRARKWLAAVMSAEFFQTLLAWAPMFVLLPVVARTRLGGNAAYGVILAMLGVGQLAGGLTAGRWRPRRPGLPAFLLLLPEALALGALAVSHDVVVVAACFAFAGFGLELSGIFWTTALQRDIPPELLARVSALDWLSILAPMPLGLALTGLVSGSLGSTTVLLGGVAVTVVTALAPLGVRGVLDLRTPDDVAPPEAPTSAVVAGGAT